MSARSLLSLAAAASSVAAYQGFNYGATFSDGSLKQEADFEAEFTTASQLEGTDGAFTSARLFTMIQGNTPNDPISAIPAAISTRTSMLFGLWASAGDAAFSSEIEALQKTIDQYCDQLDGLVAGISVGSEDLYRISPTGIANDENPGASPDTLVGYIQRVRDTIEGTCLGDIGVGHVDTWTAYVNASNNAVIEALDWVGMDAYAYFEDTKPNSIENGASLFQAAYDATVGAAGGREVWITETGWPVSGDTFGEAVPSPENARTFYRDVGCPRFGNQNVWWYTFQDSAPVTPNPSFGVVGSDLTTTPIYDLSCDNVDDGDDDDDDATPSPSSSSTGSVPEPSDDPEDGDDNDDEDSNNDDDDVDPIPEPGDDDTALPTLPTSRIVYPSPTTLSVTVEPTRSPDNPPTLVPVPIPGTDYCDDHQPTHKPEPEPEHEPTPVPLPSPQSTEYPEEPDHEPTPVPLPSPQSTEYPEEPDHEPTPVPLPSPEGTEYPEEPEQPEPEPVPSDDAGDQPPAPSEVPQALGSRMNSYGAAVVAVVLAVTML